MALDPYQGMPPGRYGHLRASTADRERAIDVLKTAFVDGRLTKDEYDERVGQVYGSRTYAELGVVTADLPVGPAGSPALQPPYPVVPGQRRTNGLAVASFILAFIPGVTSAIAIVLGLTARRRIRERGERGEGLASAAILIGILVTLVAALGAMR
jgi:Domain of unknown function (DUF1707)/Domain of unknown function (DUF4190)